MSTDHELGRLTAAFEALTAEVHTSRKEHRVDAENRRKEHRQDVKEIHERIDLQQLQIGNIEKQVTAHKGEHRGKKIMLVSAAGILGGGIVEIARFLRSWGGGP